MNIITEYDLLELETELSDIRFVAEGINFNPITNLFNKLSKFNPDRLSLQFKKLATLPSKLSTFSKAGSSVIKKRLYIRQSKEFIQSKTYFSDSDIDKVIKSTAKTIINYAPSKSDIDDFDMQPMAWSMTTMTVALYSKEHPNKRLSPKELIALVKRTCKSIQEKISSKSKGEVRFIFFIFLSIFLVNTILFKFLKNRDILPTHLVISFAVIYVYFLNKFIAAQAKYGKDVVKEEVVKRNLKTNISQATKLTNILKVFKSNDPALFVKNTGKIYSKLKVILPNTSNLKKQTSLYIDSAEDYIKENSDLTGKEISTIARQITKYVFSIFDVGMRASLFLPVSWLMIIFVISEWKTKHPDQKITKNVILKAAKEYFYKSNMKWSKYKAGTKEQKNMAYLAGPYIYFTLLTLLNTVAPEFLAHKKGIDTKIWMLYSVVASIYLIESLYVASQTFSMENDKNDK